VVPASLVGYHVFTVVSADGPGVPRADRERIFDKFTRLGDHLTRPQQGVGLGLYIARRSLEQMDGEIWCDERPGGGARFGFTLPVHAGAVRAHSSAPGASLRS
jgi:signal transduction histidine kinase